MGLTLRWIMHDGTYVNVHGFPTVHEALTFGNTRMSLTFRTVRVVDENGVTVWGVGDMVPDVPTDSRTGVDK